MAAIPLAGQAMASHDNSGGHKHKVSKNWE